MSLLKKIEAKKKKQKRVQRNKKIALGSAGLLAGAAAGILFAPKSGKELRTDIKDKSTLVKEKVNSGIDTTKHKVSESKSKIKEYLESKKAKKENEVCLDEAIETVEE